jgi:hypothetical protein
MRFYEKQIFTGVSFMSHSIDMLSLTQAVHLTTLRRVREGCMVSSLCHIPDFQVNSSLLCPNMFRVFFSDTCNIKYGVLKLMAVKSSAFWDIMPCSPVKVNRRFGGTCPSSVLKIRQIKKPAWNRQKAELCLTFTWLHCVIRVFQKKELCTFNINSSLLARDRTS